MTANVITYRSKLAAREMGKVLGFDPESLTRLSAAAGSWEWRGPDDTFDEYFRKAGFDLANSRIHCFLGLCKRVLDLPRHLGQHSGGMVVCQGRSILWSRSNPLPCQGEWSSNGTRMTAPTSALSKLIFWVWA